MITFQNVPHDGSVLAAVAYPNVRDSHLWLVLVELPGQFVSWVCDVNHWDYSHGNYQSFKTDAQPSVYYTYEHAKLVAYSTFAVRLEHRLLCFRDAYDLAGKPYARS